MADLRTLLERAAAGYEPSDEDYRKTLERAKRLRLRRRLGTVALALVIAAGGLSAAAVALLGPRHAGPTSPRPIPRAPTPSQASGLRGEILYKCGDSFCLMDANGTHRRSAHWQDAPGPQWDPAVSRDGTKVAYRGYYGPGDGMYALFVANLDGTDPTKITHDIAGDPTWSPDGRRIAFDTSGAGSIMVVNADGSGLRKLTAGDIVPGVAHAVGFDDEYPAWSPDGRRIAFVRRRVGPGTQVSQIYVMRPDGSAARGLTIGSVDFRDPTWSPDGRWIAADGLVGNHSQIYLVGVVGSSVRELLSGPGESWNPQWTPDVSLIAFLSDRADSTSLYVMNPDGSDIRLVGVTLVPGATPGDVQFTWGAPR
jgi:Tol biopolymer transport system component